MAYLLIVNRHALKIYPRNN